LILCDGGHNPEGVEGAVESTKRYFKEKLLLVTGVMADKDYRYMAGKMAEVAQEAFCLTPENPRALKAEEFAEVFRSLGVSADGYASPEEALKAAIRKAKQEKRAILCLGSLYMYGEVVEALHHLLP
jgi:dihydrofolate synthase/folylpolyglutamate synthase